MTNKSIKDITYCECLYCFDSMADLGCRILLLRPLLLYKYFNSCNEGDRLYPNVFCSFILTLRARYADTGDIIGKFYFILFW
jgi:hypothetical protein